MEALEAPNFLAAGPLRKEKGKRGGEGRPSGFLIKGERGQGGRTPLQFLIRGKRGKERE